VVVFLVDDQAMVGKVVEHMLKREEDIEFHFCQDPTEAIARACELKPTVILQDLVMPEIDGLDLVRLYRETEATRLVPLIVLSSREEPVTKAEAFARGANDYLVKLPDPIEMIARIRHHSQGYIARLERNQAYDALAELNRDLEQKVAERSAELLRSRDAVIFGLAKLAESRDDDTGQHLERICEFTEILAGEMAKDDDRLDDVWVQTVGTTSALHDIGKVATPDAVLLKPGPLTDEERKIIQKHPCLGGDTMLAIKDRWGDNTFLRTAAEIALCHHEKWDGSGYPYGLAGDEIPLSARIVALCDVYDALTSVRVYKDGMSHEEAKRIIREGAGAHFDPAVVEAFLRIDGRFNKVAQELR
jgi:putative two-component system response regulator